MNGVVVVVVAGLVNRGVVKNRVFAYGRYASMREGAMLVWLEEMPCMDGLLLLLPFFGCSAVAKARRPSRKPRVTRCLAVRQACWWHGIGTTCNRAQELQQTLL